MDAADSEVDQPVEPADDEHTEDTHDGAIDKLKDVFGKFIGAEGNRHGGRDTDPGS